MLEPPRDTLYARCDARVVAMMAAGALDEARVLAERRLPSDLPLMKAVGLRPLLACVAGALSPAQAIEQVQGDTRRYAKRQLTWFRNQAAEWPRVAPFTADLSATPH